MLRVSVSTEIVCGAAACAEAADTGLLSGVDVLGGRNFSGKFTPGAGAPAGMGSAKTGVTITISSVFVWLTCMD